MYNAQGEEILDQTPVSIPIRLNRPPTLNERIKRMMQLELSEYARQQGKESFEDADDFDIPDDEVQINSPYEEDFDPEVPFVATREAEIKGQIVEDIDDKKIEAGKKSYEKYQPKKQKPPPKEEKAESKLETDSEQKQ